MSILNDDRESLNAIREMWDDASPDLRRKLRYIAQHIEYRTPKVKAMREAIYKAKVNNDLSEIADIEDWVISHPDYQTPIYEKNG